MIESAKTVSFGYNLTIFLYGSVVKRVVLIGASTGGPGHLERVFKAIPKWFTVPVVVAQHINAHFLSTLSDSLNLASAIGVKQAKNGGAVESGGYLVSGESNRIVCKNGLLYFSPASALEENTPSVDELFCSGVDLIANGYKVLGVLLTGIGQDGAKGLLSLKLNGATTMAESEQSSVVYGMPRAACELGAVTVCADLDEIIAEIVKFGVGSGI